MRYMFIFLFLSATLLLGQVVHVSHSFYRVKITNDGTLQRVSYEGIVDGSLLMNDAGRPELPVYIKTVVLNPGEKIDTYSINAINKVELQGTFNLPVKQNVWSQEAEQILAEPDSEIFNSSVPFLSLIHI